MQYVAKCIEEALLVSDYEKVKAEVMSIEVTSMEDQKMLNLAIEQLNVVETSLGLPLTSTTPIDWPDETSLPAVLHPVPM